jgi:cell division protease FtsH
MATDESRIQDPDPQPTPWRTEGMPSPGSSGPTRPRWSRILLWAAVFYLSSFLVFSVFDALNAPAQISYTEFQHQVQVNNVAEVYARGDTIQGVLKEASPVPDTSLGQLYKTFTTERPTFAQDDLLSAGA